MVQLFLKQRFQRCCIFLSFGITAVRAATVLVKDAVDTFISSQDPARNHGDDSILASWSELDGEVLEQVLIKFPALNSFDKDLIQSAQLHMYEVTSFANTNFEIAGYRMTWDWDDDVTWQQDFGSDGIQPGVETEQTPSFRMLVDELAAGSDWGIADVTDDVHYWLSLPDPARDNQGWVLFDPQPQCATEDIFESIHTFYSNEYSDDETKRPFLELTTFDIAYLSVAFANSEQDENSGTFTCVVTRTSDDLHQTNSVDYDTVPVTATVGQDFSPSTGTLTFAPGETTKTFTISVIDDADIEGEEVFAVQLSNPQPAARASIVVASALARIRDDDTSPPTLVPTAAPNTKTTEIPSQAPVQAPVSPGPPSSVTPSGVSGGDDRCDIGRLLWG